MKKETPRHHKKWTIEEVEYLEEKWGNMAVGSIARNLGRNINSVTLKARKLGLGSFFESGNLVLLKDVIEALGYHYVDTVVDQLKKYNCPIQYTKFNKRTYRKIHLDDFWEWAEQHQDILSFKKFEPNTLGKEPDWVYKKRKLDQNIPKNTYNHWTKEEEMLLVAKAKSNRYNLSQLSLEFNRTEAAIRMKLFQLGYKTPNNGGTNQYTKEEEFTILQMKKDGYTFKSIAEKLQRSRNGVAWKYKQLISI